MERPNIKDILGDSDLNHARKVYASSSLLFNHIDRLDGYIDFLESVCASQKAPTSESALPISTVVGNEVALKLKLFAEQQTDIPDDIRKIINDNFWDML